MLGVVKFAAKIGIVCSAVYVTVDNSIWDKSESASKVINKVKKSLPETTELFKALPNTDTVINNWNSGVENVFKTATEASGPLKEKQKELVKALFPSDKTNVK